MIKLTYKITSYFGQKETFRSHGHSGLDFAMPNGTEIRSIKSGYVEKIVDYGHHNAGKTIFVKWEDGQTAIYGHLSRLGELGKGDHVNAGQLIGYSGNTGHVVGSNGGYHLHFGLKSGDGHLIDPSPYIKDIEHMNDSNYFVSNHITKIPEIIRHSHSLKDLLKLQSDTYADFFTTLKINIIAGFRLFDYTILIQYIQHLF